MVKNSRGITLVELLAVMVIMGIIAAISIPAIGNLIENSRKDAYIATAQNLVEASRLVVSQNPQACTEECLINFSEVDDTQWELGGATYIEHLDPDYENGVAIVAVYNVGAPEYSIVLWGSTEDSYRIADGYSEYKDPFQWTRDMIVPAIT